MSLSPWLIQIPQRVATPCCVVVEFSQAKCGGEGRCGCASGNPWLAMSGWLWSSVKLDMDPTVLEGQSEVEWGWSKWPTWGVKESTTGIKWRLKCNKSWGAEWGTQLTRSERVPGRGSQALWRFSRKEFPRALWEFLQNGLQTHSVDQTLSLRLFVKEAIFLCPFQSLGALTLPLPPNVSVLKVGIVSCDRMWNSTGCRCHVMIGQADSEHPLKFML